MPLIAISHFVQVGYSAILFYGYVGLVGLMLYACLRWWFKSKVSLAQVWCIYGRHTIPGCSQLWTRTKRIPIAKAWTPVCFPLLQTLRKERMCLTQRKCSICWLFTAWACAILVLSGISPRSVLNIGHARCIFSILRSNSHVLTTFKYVD